MNALIAGERKKAEAPLREATLRPLGGNRKAGRFTCGHGQAHPLSPPQGASKTNSDGSQTFKFSARCAGCGRTFHTPNWRVPLHHLIAARSFAAMQRYLGRWGVVYLRAMAMRP